MFSSTSMSSFLDARPAHYPEDVNVAQVCDQAEQSRRTNRPEDLTPGQHLHFDATQKYNYCGISATSHKDAFKDHQATMVAKRRWCPGPGHEELFGEATLNAAVEYRRRANAVAARRFRQRKLEYVRSLKKQLEEKTHEAELWKARAIPAENIVRCWRLEEKAE